MLFILAVCIVSISCQEESTNYSCNSVVNRWVKDNLDDIATMTRGEFIQLNDLSLQRGVYIAFTPEQKASVWTEKIKEVLAMDWNEKEREHIEKLLIVIEQNYSWFASSSVKISKEEDQIQLFSYKWIDYAANELNWDGKLIYGIVSTPNILISKDGEVLETFKPAYNASLTRTRLETENTSPQAPSCDCNIGESWKFIICPVSDADLLLGNNPCIALTCTKKRSCGLLWLSECDGMCKLYL